MIDEHGAKGWRELVYPALDNLANLGAKGRARRGFGLAVDDLGFDAVAFLITSKRHHNTLTLVPAQPHQGLVDRDAGQPGRDLRLAAEVPNVPVRLEIRVLHGVFRLGVVLEDRARDAEEPAVVSPHQPLESGVIVRRDAVDELDVRVLST
jgi:hypothetical protein